MSEDAGRVAEVRDAYVDELRTGGMIASSVVEAAFRVVPRHVFVPEGTPLDVAYNVDESVVTRRDEHGVAISSVSAPFIQARMIEQAGLRCGMRVWEVGSGGYNAALLAEVVGPTGRVVSVDIDPEVVAGARMSLAANGYGDRVEVLQVDAEHGLPGADVFDAIVVTVGAWDIPPAWLDRLTADGVLVVPLVMNGVTRSIGFRRTGDHLVSTSAEVCGFVSIRGAGEHAERVFLLPDPAGGCVRLRFDNGAPPEPHLLDGVLAAGDSEVWSGVTIGHQTSFADLHLWLACFLPDFCRFAADAGTGLAERRGTWFPFGGVAEGSFAYLAVRPALAGAGVEFGAGGYGPHAEAAATALVEQVQAWDRQARGGPAPTFGFWPAGADRSGIPAGAVRMEKTHGVVTISWPAAG